MDLSQLADLLISISNSIKKLDAISDRLQKQEECLASLAADVADIRAANDRRHDAVIEDITSIARDMRILKDNTIVLNDEIKQAVDKAIENYDFSSDINDAVATEVDSAVDRAVDAIDLEQAVADAIEGLRISIKID